MLNKAFLLTQHADWTRHLTELSAELKVAGAPARAAKAERMRKGAEWRAHYARLLRDGHGVDVIE